VKRTGFSSVFQNRDFCIFCASQTVSQFGDKLDHRALIALLGVLAGGSPSALAQLAFFFTLPVLLFGPISGALVDRWDRKKVMVSCDLFRGGLVALVPLAVFLTHSLWSVYSIVFLVFLFGLFFNNAKMSIIPNLVEKEKLLAANSVNTLIGRVATVLAFFLGDLIVYWRGWGRLKLSGWQASFYLDGVTFFFSALAIGLISVAVARSSAFRSVQMPRGAFLRAFYRTFRDIREGIELILAKREITFVMTSVIVLTFLGGSVYVLAVPIVQSELHVGAFSVGTLGAILAVGMVIGSFVFGSIGHRLRKSTVITVGFAFIGVLMVVFSTLRDFAITSVTIAVAGVALAPIMISQDTLLHEVVPEEIRGRVFGTREWTLNGLFMASAALMGVLARFTSARATLRGAGALVLLLGLVGIVARRKMVDETV
jgi:MFS family permease